MFGPVCYTIFQMAQYSGSIPPAGHGRGFRRSTVSWPPLRGGSLPARADWGSMLPPEVTSWLLRVKAPLCRGSLFSVPSAPAAIFPLNNSCQAGGACRRPYIHRRYCLPPLIRHGLRHATFPQGKAILRRVGTLLRHPTVHPLSRPWRQRSRGMTATGSHVDSYSLRGAQPYTPGAFSLPQQRTNTGGGPPVLVHFLILQRRLFDFCVSSGVF